MVAWALYLDETGVPEKHNEPLEAGQTPAFTLAGVALPLDRWREYDRQYLYLKREFFPAEIERSTKIDALWEVKGNDLLAPRNAKSERNSVFARRVMNLVADFNGKVFGVTFLKGAVKPMPKTSIYTKGLQILAERFNTFLREENSSGVLVLDSRMAHTQKGRGLDYTVAQSYLSFVFGNAEGRNLDRIVEAPLFADSSLTAGLQIADIIAFLSYTNAYREKLAPAGAVPEFGFVDYSHTRRYWPQFKDLVFQSRELHGAQKMFGLRVLDHRDGPAKAAGKREALQALQQKYNRQKSG